MKNSLLLIIVLSEFIVFSGCDSLQTEPEQVPIDLSRSWVIGLPAEQAMNKDMLNRAIFRAAQNPRFLSLLVARRGKLVVEEYFNGNRLNNLNDVRSVTKSIVSTLVAIALEEGFIGSLDENLEDYFIPQITDLSEEKSSISIRHLLSMTSGFLWDESGGYGDYNTWINSEDHIRFVLDRPLIYTPGSVFTYNSAAVHLLGVLLAEATDMTLPDFADQYLFRKIGIEQSQWEILSEGYANGGSGIDLRPRDLARIGQLYLQGGVSGATRIFPSAWVSVATTPRFNWRSSYATLASYTYGYLWWIEEGKFDKMFFAWGFGGQFIFVVPPKDLVIVTTTNWRNISADGGPDPLQHTVLDIIINDVIASAD